MISVLYTAKFIRMYKDLEPALKDEIRDKILDFENEANHKKLKVHKLRGEFKKCFSFSINYKIRIVFEYENKKTVNLLYVGGHDEVYK